MFPWVFVVILLLAAAILYARTRAAGSGFISGSNVTQLWRRPARANHRPAIERKDFRAVSIKCGDGACRAAQILAGKRGFPNQIPRLPLSQCDAANCACSYEQHADRRANDDRRRLYAMLSGAPQDSSERRRVEDRRNLASDNDLDGFNFSDT